MHNSRGNITQYSFGEYIESRLAYSNRRPVRELFNLYRKMAKTTSFNKFIKLACQVSNHIDQNLQIWPKALGGTVTPFSIFRGYFLEEITLHLARIAIRQRALSSKLEVIKLPTGGGVVTGFALAFRGDNIPNPVPIFFRRDREDVIVGFRRTLKIQAPSGKKYISFPNEIIPICMIA